MSATPRMVRTLFLAGAVCALVTLIVYLTAPELLILGIIAGLSAGFVTSYVTYDFRHFLTSVPIAFEESFTKGVVWFENVNNGFQTFKKWLHLNGPMVAPPLVAGLILSIPSILWVNGSITRINPGRTFSPLIDVPVWGVVFLCFLALWFVLGLILLIEFRDRGLEEWAHAYSFPFFLYSTPDDINKAIQKHEAAGRSRMPLTYTNVLLWAGEGLLLDIRYLLKMPFWLIWKVILFVGHLIWLIHSKERLLCATYGSAGGLISFFRLAPSATTLSSQIVLVLSGGVIGVTIGILIWEVFSIRVFHLAPRSTS